MDFKYFNSHLLNKVIQGAKGNYKIIKLIAAGTGGMVMEGQVDNMKKVAVKYQSFISEHETNVCLKFLASSFSNIVNILDIFKNQSHPGYFIIMDFADMPLTKYIYGKNEFSDTKSQQFQSMIKQICFGIHELHQMKIIHRDFKPDNIVVKLDNNTTKYMLCDLGLVRTDENDHKKTKQIGTPMFMAPELLGDEQYSVKVDIWALGCMLYSLLARKHLFEGNSAQLTLEQVSKSTQQEIDAKISQIYNIDEEFKQLLRKMIQIKQSDRLSIKQVIEQINKYYENINKQQLGQIQFNNQFIPQQIIINQKPKLVPQQQLKIQYDRIQRSNQIQCEQMKDNLKFKLNEQEQLLVLQYNKQGKSYSYQDVQQIIKQTIQAVQSKSFDVIDLLYVAKIELDKKMALEQMGQKDLKYLGHQTELNQKQMEINKNMEKMNNLQEQLKAFEIDKQENDKKIKDLQDQLSLIQNQLNEQNYYMQNQQEEMQLLKAQLQSQFTELQNKEMNHSQEINKLITLKQESDKQLNLYKQQLENVQKDFNQQKQLLQQEFDNNKQIEINRLLELNQQYLNQYEQQKQFIVSKIPEYEATIQQLQDNLKQAECKIEQAKYTQQQENQTINQLEEKLKLGEQKLAQAKNNEQQDEKKSSSDDSINKNQVMLGYLEKLTDYFKQQENSQQNKSDLINNDPPILNNTELKQIKVQQEVQPKFVLQNFVPNQQINPTTQNNFQQQYGQQWQFQNNKPINQEQNLQQQFKPINQNIQFQPQQQYPSVNFNPQFQQSNFVNQNNAQYTPNQIAPNPSFQSLQSPQVNGQTQQLQGKSNIFKPSTFIPNFQKQDQK